MFIYVYLFGLGLGGVLLLTSLFMGGDSDGDVDSSADAEGDGDSAGDHGQQGLQHGADTHGSLGGLFTVFLSLRFWTFFLAFFGLTGLVVDGLDLLDGSWPALALAAGTGWITGYIAVSVIRGLSHRESGRIASTADYIGTTGRVLLPVSRSEVGKIRLEIRGTTVDLLARAGEDVTLAPGTRAMIVQVDGTTAVVTAATTLSEDVP